jgi:hypothetical protein
MGMQNTGYSESSQVSYYNTYQNRVATARESFNQAVLDYNNAITQARLQNNSILAEIAANALKQRLELSLQGFQYKNQLLLDLSNKKLEVDNLYHQRYQDVLAQINQENSLAEQIRQFNEQMAFQREQFEWQKGKASSYTYRKQKTDDDTVIDKNKSGDDTIDEKGGSDKPMDLQSVLDLGGGPRSATDLAKQEKEGKIMVVDAGDRYVAVPKPSSNPLSGGLNKYGPSNFASNPADPDDRKIYGGMSKNQLIDLMNGNRRKGS